jgi:hypothetical protein
MAAEFGAIEPVAAGEEPDAERLAQAAERAMRSLTEAADAAG